MEEAIVVTTAWMRRDWHALLTQMACEILCRIVTRMDLLSQKLQDKGTLYHADMSSLHLAVWKLSTNPLKMQAFHERLLVHILPASESPLQLYKPPDGPSTLAFVLHNIKIPFLHLSV